MACAKSKNSNAISQNSNAISKNSNTYNNATRTNNKRFCRCKYISWMFDFFSYFKLRNILIDIKMNAEDLLVNIPLDIPQDVQHAAGQAAGQAAGTQQQHVQQQQHMDCVSHCCRRR